MVKSAEVIIIGAGVIGCSIAYHLAKKGCHDVIVLEKDSIGSGSTDRCPGGIRQQFSTEINIKLSMESVSFFQHFEEQTGHTADFHQNGYLMLATTEDELKAFQQNVALQHKLGLEVYLLSAEEVRKIMPQLNIEDVKGGTFCPSDGHADPYSVAQGFASSTRRLGSKIHEATEITGINIAKDKAYQILTDKGNFAAPVVVNAAGPYAAQVGAMVGLDIPIRPSRRHIFITAPTNEVARNSPMIIEFRNGFWLRREGHGLIFGMRNPDEPESFDTSVDWGFLSTLAEAAVHRAPFLKDTGIMRGQAGLHADTPDYNAILGEAPGMEGLFLACGFSGHGFMHSPAVGRIMAERILDRNYSPEVSLLGLGRFNNEASPKENCFI